MGFLIFFNWNYFFFTNSELITSLVALLSNNTSTVIHFCISILFFYFSSSNSFLLFCSSSSLLSSYSLLFCSLSTCLLFFSSATAYNSNICFCNFNIVTLFSTITFNNLTASSSPYFLIISSIFIWLISAILFLISSKGLFFKNQIYSLAVLCYQQDSNLSLTVLTFDSGIISLPNISL